ncbi:interleukin-15 receptor subunit alpha isoform X2 [Triplophysa rosa]|uniref:interleukin-15 receptor subunit alpha isoform X2 n=1 Tax=Triplophysa rosa TaxID=992332 RepID=UPI0025461088|nr:interleukin-15 receptor subunit alpha isoform X2 [Triplophysa rosa]
MHGSASLVFFKDAPQVKAKGGVSSKWRFPSHGYKCRIFLRNFHLNVPGEVDMHVLIIFIFATAEYHHNIAGANGVCDSSPQIDNAMPVTSTYPVNDRIRINCTDGYVRKSGTSNLFRCIEENGKPTWTQTRLPLQCIRDPKKPIISTDPPKTEQNFTTSTKERAQTSRIPGTSMPTAGVNTSSKTTTSETLRDSHNEGTFSHMNKSTIGGTVGVGVILCLTAAVFLLWWRSRHRASNATNEIQIHHSNNATCTYYIPVPVSDSEHYSAEPNIADAADASTAVSK